MLLSCLDKEKQEISIKNMKNGEQRDVADFEGALKLIKNWNPES